MRREALGEVAARLHSVRDGLCKCRTFGELYDLVRATIESVHGIGELMVYDTATRLGAHLDLMPDRVYLHAGTRAGAEVLGFSGRDTIRSKELPAPLQQLEPYELEDCLCIYKEHLDGRLEPSPDT